MSEQGWQPKRGDEGRSAAKEWQEKNQRDFGPSRFFMKPGNTAKVTFLDSDGFYFMEHNLKINGKWGNTFTCRSEFSECPVCESGDRPSYVCAYTVIDHTGYTDKDGKDHKNLKRLMVVKSRVMDKLARRKQQLEGDLTYQLFEVSRDTKEECSTGEDFSSLKRLTKEDLLKFAPKGLKDKEGKEIDPEEWIKPFDYMALFAPKSVEELRNVVGMEPPIGSESSSSPTQSRPSSGSSVDEQNIEDLL